MTKRLIAAAIIFALLTPGVANAGGFLADIFVRPISPQTADDLDKVHKNLGNPLDHAANAAAGAAANAVVPGSGKVVTDVLETRDAVRRNQ